MHTDNLLDLLLPELIQFILKDLSIQDLKNCCINDVWEKKVSPSLDQRSLGCLASIFFRVFLSPIMNVVNYQDFYLKLKKCNKSVGYHEEQLKWLFLYGLSPENKIKVLMDGLQALALDEILESLSPE